MRGAALSRLSSNCGGCKRTRQVVARCSLCCGIGALLRRAGRNGVVHRNVGGFLAADLPRPCGMLFVRWSTSARRSPKLYASAPAGSLGRQGAAHGRCTGLGRFTLLHTDCRDDGRCCLGLRVAACVIHGSARVRARTHRAARERRFRVALECAACRRSGASKRVERHRRRHIACTRRLLWAFGMIAWRSSLRRLLLVLIALACAWPMLRPAISSALVTRGDALLYARDTRAQIKYRLALQIDPGNIVAADRYVFAAFLLRTNAELEDGVRVADLVLLNYPGAIRVRMDRALCLQRLRKYALAERDFERVGEQRGDVQALALAASDAARSSDSAKAKRLLRLAERIDPKYTPVRVALTRVR